MEKIETDIFLNISNKLPPLNETKTNINFGQAQKTSSPQINSKNNSLINSSSLLSSSSISKSIIDINSQSKKERAKSERNQSSSRNLATISKSKLENKFSESPLQSNFETKSKHDTSSPYSKRNTQTIQSPSVRDYKIEKLDSAISVTNNQKKEIKPSSKPRNILIIIKNISVAINKLRNRTKFKPIKYLESEQIELIGDKAFFPQQNENLNKEMIKMLLSKNIFSIYFYKIKIFIKKVRVLKIIGKLFKFLYLSFKTKMPVISPENKIKMLWDLIMIFINIFLLFILTFQMSFDFFFLNKYLENNSLIKKLIAIFIITIFTIDIFLKFFTGYYKDGILVLQLEKLVKKYFFSGLGYDLIAFSPIFLNVIFALNPESLKEHQELIKYFGFLFFFKLFDISKIINSLEAVIHLSENGEAYFKLFKLIAAYIFVIHLLACLWHAVTFYSTYNKNALNWTYFADGELNTNRIPSWFPKYLNCIYWSISYGKVDPQNSLEHAYGAFAAFVFEISSAFIIGGILNIIRLLSNKEDEKKSSMRAINEYMRKKNIEYDLQIKVRQYLNFIYDQTENIDKEKELIEKLSNSLKEEVLIRANGTILKNISLFSKNFSEETLRKTVFLMKNIKFYPEEIIYTNTDLDRSLYLIIDGEIDIYLENDNNKKHQIKKLKKGDFFGEYSFFTDTNRVSCAMSTNFASVFSISRNEFISMIKENPLDYEKYCMIRDQMMLFKNIEENSHKCFLCKKDHSFMDCPSVHYIPQKEFLISKHLFNRPIVERINFQRRKNKGKNCLSQLKVIQFSIKKFLAETEQNEETDEDFSESNSTSSIEEEKETDTNVENKITSQTRVSSKKKSLAFQDKMPSNNLIKKEITSVIDETNEDDKDLSSIVVDDKGPTTPPPQRKTIMTTKTIIKEENYRSMKTMETQDSRKFSVYPDPDNPIIRSLIRERSTKINSGIYPQGSVITTDNKNEMYLRELEKMCIFSVYFTHNNADNIIKKIVYNKIRSPSRYNKESKSKRNRKSTIIENKNTSFLAPLGKLPSLKSKKNTEAEEMIVKKALGKKKSFFVD